MKTCKICGDKLGFFDSLFSKSNTCKYCKNKSEPTHNISNNDIIIDENSISIHSLDLFGEYSISQNHNYILAWCDSYTILNNNGIEEKISGKYALLKGKHIVLSGELQRPNDGKVANNGNFILNDWLNPNKREGIFYAFDSIGNILIKHQFYANLYNNGISTDGRYSVCQLANSDTVDGRTLNLFDLEKKLRLWQLIPKDSGTKSYCIDSDKNVVGLIYDNNSRYDYDFNGKFLDGKRWTASLFENADGFFIHSKAKHKIKTLGSELNEESANEIIKLLKDALNQGTERYPKEQANIHRTTGEIHEYLGHIKLAIKHYEKALNLNPKVGVKRKLIELKKNNT